jgi:hypothetical protein
MIEHLLHPRITESKDWAGILFVFSFAIIAITKSAYENRFSDFINLIFSDKYAKVYRDGSHLNDLFTISLFFVQVISLSFFIQLSISFFGYGSKTDLILYIQILTFLIFFILAKYLMEKIIATAFNIEEFVAQLNLQKVTYRTYIGIFILPINLILFYYDSLPRNILPIIIYTLMVINVLVYLISIKKYQNLIFSKMFYFILYLCALEIAPYFFMFFMFKKGGA